MSFESFVPEGKKHILEDINKWFQKFTQGKLAITDWDGFKYPPGFVAETAKYYYENYIGFKETDVIIISYAKTGRNWTIEIISQILEVENPIFKQWRNIPMAFQSTEFGPKVKFEIFDIFSNPRRLYRSHVTGDKFPVERALQAGAKIVYVLRNPKDQTVSWYHFSRTAPFPADLKKKIFPDDWNEFTNKYFSGQQPMSVKEGEWYPEHILSWYKYKDERNVKFLYYEDMKKDTVKEIQGIAKFLEINLSDKDAKDIADRCSFDAMKTRLETKRKDQAASVMKKTNLLRKGQVGNWKEYFTVAQSEAIDDEFQRKLSHTDIKFTYQL